jgi:hypothetical protein
MPPREYLLLESYVLSDAGYILEGMHLSCDLQNPSMEAGILKHNHGIEIRGNRHSRSDRKKPLHEDRGMGSGAPCILGSDCKAVHCSAIESWKADGRAYILEKNPAVRKYGLNGLGSLRGLAEIEKHIPCSSGSAKSLEHAPESLLLNRINAFVYTLYTLYIL